MAEIGKIDVSDWRFDHGEVGEDLLKKLSQNVVDVFVSEIEEFSFDWVGDHIEVKVWMGDDILTTTNVTLSDIVDKHFEWDMSSDSEDGKFCLKIADALEAQAKRLRDGVREADEL